MESKSMQEIGGENTAVKNTKSIIKSISTNCETAVVKNATEIQLQ